MNSRITATRSGKCRRRALDADAIRAGEAHAPVLLHDRDQRCGIERRGLDELKRAALGARVDLGDALAA